MFVQTTVFVMFNKVITAQYFLWYVTLLPMVLVGNKLTNTKKYLGMALVFGFIFFDANWNRASYGFEFAGEHAFKDIQLANYLWFWYTLIAMQQVVINYKLQVTQPIGEGKKEIAGKQEKANQPAKIGKASNSENASPQGKVSSAKKNK